MFSVFFFFSPKFTQRTHQGIPVADGSSDKSLALHFTLLFFSLLPTYVITGWILILRCEEHLTRNKQFQVLFQVKTFVIKSVLIYAKLLCSEWPD